MRLVALASLVCASSATVQELMNHADGRHGFDILDDDDRSREILSLTLAFLKARLGR